ncbi:hypothetical protein EV363DRAFT_1403995 [Boletus edulis]|nr:hypothetical protein EV363DRAFT_1403995 [Boletus edulis]
MKLLTDCSVFYNFHGTKNQEEFFLVAGIIPERLCAPEARWCAIPYLRVPCGSGFRWIYTLMLLVRPRHRFGAYLIYCMSYGSCLPHFWLIDRIFKIL